MSENIGNIIIYNCLEMNGVEIFAGTLGIDLQIVDKNLFKWRDDDGFIYLTLDEIYKQFKSIYKHEGICTVVVSTPLHGEIYQCGNYHDGEWVEYGHTIGYA